VWKDTVSWLYPATPVSAQTVLVPLRVQLCAVHQYKKSGSSCVAQNTNLFSLSLQPKSSKLGNISVSDFVDTVMNNADILV